MQNDDRLKGFKPLGTYPFGGWLRRQIDTYGLSQAELARQTGIDPGLVSHWANGRRLPGAESCELIAEVLGIPRDTVLEAAGRWTPEPDSLRDPKRAELTDLARTLPASELDTVLEYTRWRMQVAREKVANSPLGTQLVAGAVEAFQ